MPWRVTSTDKVGLHDLAAASQLLHCPFGQDGTLGHHHHRITKLVHDGQLVLDHEDGHPVVAECHQLVADPPGQVRVHAGHRLVEPPHARLGPAPAHDLA